MWRSQTDTSLAYCSLLQVVTMRTSSNACRTMITTTTGGIYKNVYRCLSRGCQAEEYKCLYKFLLVLTKADKDTCNVTYIHDVAHLKRNWDKEKDSAARSLPRSFSAKLNATSMQFKVNRPKQAKEIVQPYTAIFTSTQQMNQLQCKIGEIAQEIVRGILTGKDISKGRHNTPRGPNAISRCKCNTRWYILKIGREGSISVIQGAKQL